MAYMDQERKALLAAELKKVVPAGWKYTLAVRNHSTIVMTITEAPVDLCTERVRSDYSMDGCHFSVNPYWVETQFKPGAARDAIVAILSALNTGNHDRSDTLSDHFDVGWYVDLNVGRWDKPFVATGDAS